MVITKKQILITLLIALIINYAIDTNIYKTLIIALSY